jgi:hypothetical protein
VEEVTGRLKAATDDEPALVRADGKLYLMEEGWMAHLRQRDQGAHGCAGAVAEARARRMAAQVPRRAEGAALGRINAGDMGRPVNGPGTAQRSPSMRRPMWSKERRMTALPFFFAAASIGVEATPASAAAHLMEKKVVLQLDGDAKRDTGLWYLDTGATNHMTGARDAFTELDTSIQGMVKFGDGFVVSIEGCGSIMFETKTGEHRRLLGVYYIPRLTANIVSLGQLDEGGCKVDIDDGVLRIWDQRRRLVARVRRSPGRLYLLRMMIAKPVSMLARKIWAPSLRRTAEAGAG